MLALEPILLCMAFYISVVFGNSLTQVGHLSSVAGWSIRSNTRLAPDQQKGKSGLTASHRRQHTLLTMFRTRTRDSYRPHKARRILPPIRHHLARMDEFSNRMSKRLASNPRRRSGQFLHPAHQHAGLDLHRRLLRCQRQLCGRGYHIHALAFCLWIISVRKIDEHILGRVLCYDTLRTLRCPSGASTCAILLLCK